MNANFLLKAILSAATVLVPTSCVHKIEEQSIAVQEVSRKASTLDGKRIVTSGFLIQQPLGGFYLYPNSQSARVEDYSDGIDVVATGIGGKAQLKDLSRGECVRLSGLFTHFGESVLVTGNFRSSAGRIDIKEVAKTKCL